MEDKPKTFNYRVKGSADKDWNERQIEAHSIGEAEDKLDTQYGVQRDDNGDQTNTDVIQVEVLGEAE